MADIEKPGFVTNVSGAVLDLAAGATDRSITFSFLHSYLPGMGAARLTCHDGCTCAAQEVDARRPPGGGNVMSQYHFGVTPAPNCTLRVTTEARPPLKGDGPSGTRFKVMGLAVGGKKAQAGLGGEVRWQRGAYIYIRSRVHFFACVHRCSNPHHTKCGLTRALCPPARADAAASVAEVRCARPGRAAAAEPATDAAGGAACAACGCARGAGGAGGGGGGAGGGGGGAGGGAILSAAAAGARCAAGEVIDGGGGAGGAGSRFRA
jgi:hypothetical protein